MSQTVVNAITQDHLGFMWFGTQDGLNQYDGYNFKIFRHDPLDPKSISDNHIRSLFTDKDGNLWIGTYSGGLDRFDREKCAFVHYRHSPQDINSLSNNEVSVIFQDQEGILWFGTWGGGLNRFNGSPKTFSCYRNIAENPRSLSHNLVKTVCEDSRGIMWVGTYGGGLNRFNKKTGTFSRYIHDPADPNSLSNDHINCIYETRVGVLWIGTDGGGLNRMNRENGTFVHYTNTTGEPKGLNHNIVEFIHEDKNGMLWIGTDGGGINLFDPVSETFSHYVHNREDSNSLSYNRTLTIYQDNTSILWIGTYGGGINKYDPERLQFYHFGSTQDNLNSNDIRALFEDRHGILWIGTYGAGLGRLDKKTGRISYLKNEVGNPNSLSDNHILSLLEDRTGMLWIGTARGGLNALNPKTGKVTHYKYKPHIPDSLSYDMVRSLYEDKKGRLWIGTQGGGLNRFNQDAKNFTHYRYDPNSKSSLTSDRIFPIREDRNGLLWIGTFGGGLNKFDPESEKFFCYKNAPDNPNSLSNNRILSLHEDRNAILWVGTDGGGLNRFNRNNRKWTHYTKDNGLPNNIICGILEDHRGNLWISTNTGLSKFNPKTGGFSNFSIKEGLQNIEFNACAYHKSRLSGEMFFGGINGINSFFPDTIRPNPYINPLVITAFRKFNKIVQLPKSIDKVKEIQLSQRDNFFSFDFVAPEYRNPGKNKYSYMLEGFDRDWIPSNTRRYANYTNVPGGKYVFRVKASNQEGNKTETAVSIKIMPPFWRTWWFILPVALFTLALIFAINQIRTHLLRRQIGQLKSIISQLNRQADDRKEGELLHSVLYRISETAHSDMHYYDLFQSIHESIGSLIDAENFYIALYDAQEKTITLPYFMDKVDDFLGKTLKASKGLTEYVINTGKPLLINSRECKALIASGEVELVGSPAAIWLGVPLRFKGEILGAVVIQHYTDSGAYTEKDRDMLAFASVQIAGVINRKREEDEKRALKEKLAVSEKMEAIGRLAGSVAHDLNNVLSAIVSYPELLLLKMPKDSPHRKSLITMHRSGKKAAAIVQDLLTLARRGMDIKEVVNWNDVVKDYCRSTEFDKLKKQHPNITVEVDLANSLLNIEGSPLHLSKALGNLCANAAEAMREGGIIYITTANLHQEEMFEGFDIGNYVVVTVANEGQGIAQKDLKRIFEPFYIKKEKGISGTGLGMAIVWNTISDHKGYINVGNRNGYGTTFELYFPVTKRTASKANKITKIEEFLGNGERILVVDDLPEQREILAVLLEELGYNVESASSGEEAVKFLKSHMADLVILDMIMDPGMDGLDTYKEIVKFQPEIKAIIASGYSETNRVKKALKLGVGAYIKKPYTLDKFGIAIKNELNKTSNDVRESTKEDI